MRNFLEVGFLEGIFNLLEEVKEEFRLKIFISNLFLEERSMEIQKLSKLSTKNKKLSKNI